MGNLEPGEPFGSSVVRLNTPLRREASAFVAEHGGELKGYLHGKFKRGWVVLGPGAEAPRDHGETLPEMCVAVLQPEDVLIGIKRDEPGYFQMYDGMVTGQAARVAANRINRALSVTPQQREAMLVGSMMGWGCPAARPSSDLHQQAVDYPEAPAS